MHITLLVPAPFSTLSGGYAYDRRMVDTLRTMGHQVQVVELVGIFPLTDDVARDAACAAWDALPPDTRPVIDGLALPAFAGMDDALAARGAIGLIHHPTALETGLSEADQANLHRTEQRLFAHLSCLIVTSEPTAEALATGFGVDRPRISVVVPGTDNAPRCMGSGTATCEILSIGSLIPRKGYDVLLRALARLFDLDWHLTIVGDADRNPVHARDLVALVDELGLAQHVRFAGPVSGAALETLWQGADLFTLPSLYEGYGMVIAEALKRGLPVAVTAVGAAATLVPPEAGTISPPNDRDQLSKSLRRLIFGRELRKHMAEIAWEAGQILPSWDSQAALFAQTIG
jgi:glycosyltransferase involved in cell wall biosynthesis